MLIFCSIRARVGAPTTALLKVYLILFISTTLLNKIPAERISVYIKIATGTAGYWKKCPAQSSVLISYFARDFLFKRSIT